MVTIGSTLYYVSANQYKNDRTPVKSEPENAFPHLTDQQDAASITDEGTYSLNAGSAVESAKGPSTRTVIFQGKVLNLKLLNPAFFKAIWELPEEQYQEYLSGQEMLVKSLEFKYTERLDAESVEASFRAFPPLLITQPYATVKVGGSVVATLDNQGVVTMSDAMRNRLQNKLPESLDKANGPDLAQAMAEIIARLVGGRVEKSSTAITQRQFDAVSWKQPEPKVDYEALRNDPWYVQLQDMKQKRADYLAQQGQ